MDLHNRMDWEDYLDYIQQINTQQITSSPYDDEKYLTYTQKNWGFMSDVLKNITLNAKLYNALEKINQPLHWVVLTEPWCGDAAHTVPAIATIAQAAPDIHLHILLRDSNDPIMNRYLTNGGKAIPKLICFDATFEKELFVWGPRPTSLQAVVEQQYNDSLTFSEKINKINEWYLHDNSAALQEELLVLIKNTEK